MHNVAGNRWDIFCKIVDNFGDIGVCWRLSQQLAREHHLRVRLFIDDFATAKKIIPALDVTKQSQYINSVEICTWPINNISPAETIIETFSCALPDDYVHQMVRNKSTWINLEYLSAEAWVGDFHAKPSPHPTLAITKHYFFPGFKSDTGGLICEKNLIAARDVFLNSIDMQTEFWRALNLTNTLNLPLLNQSIKISLFCYAQANVVNLLSALAKSNQAISLLLPNNGTIEEIKPLLTHFLHKNVSIYLLPFLSQASYDKLLWACDLNFVRGEDSWLRAIWAGKPFIWQPYIQTEESHIKKLKAFLEMYTNEAPENIKSILCESHLAWSNACQLVPWHNLLKQLTSLQRYAKTQSNRLAHQPDLATKLVFFSDNLAKSKV